MYSEQFSHLDRLLAETREFWQFMPFSADYANWEAQYPELCQWLMGLDEHALAGYLADTEALADKLSQWIPQVVDLQAASQLTMLEKVDRLPPRGIDTGIPGRKWQQLLAFNGVMPQLGLPWLEWCSGKGYLGRVLSATHQTPVTSLEWQQALCDDGAVAAKRLGLPMTFVQGDAFAEESSAYIVSRQHAVALHACGDLHVSLLKQVAAKQGQAVSISPCCYHLIRDKEYQPMSALGQQSVLRLSKLDLKLPLQETVTAGNRVRNLRFVEVSYRLGFDSLQRDLLGEERYLPVPNCQKALFNDGFEGFCRWAAEKKGITLPQSLDYRYWQQCGEQRYHWVERLELLRQVFRRPLEMWLVYDRACFLEDAGYAVTVGTFCDKPMTPRNIMIHAERKQ
ncbi:SAM-dependent methyltransferase [Photobacterium aquae]|uniref:SAM-dependent methyltransferase n=1 Tax=Photobacterium aquae TaxID=1195763 RepID=A0A0J1HBN6_9GAMM|nr:methyltransferase [Photobacterium aquae]KLV09046.1 SAM-dependent methyltransferase [Photobacterium aquae]